MKTILSTLIILTLFIFGCEKKYSLEESKMISETEDLIIDYKASVSMQEKYLISIYDTTKTKEFRDFQYNKHQAEWLRSIDLKSVIDRNISTLRLAGIKYDFGELPDDLSIERWEYLQEQK